MRVLFIRHAPALNRSDWLRDDMLRPLSDKGMTAAKKIFKGLSKVYKVPQAVFTSEAVRAKESAEIFSRYFGSVKVKESPALNPRATFEGVKELLLESNLEYVAVIGHEPDLSEIISMFLVKNGDLPIEIKKAALVELEIDDDNFGVLKSLIPPKIFS